MKYVLLFYATPESTAEFDALPPDAQARRFNTVMDWLREHQSCIVEASRLEPPERAVQVRFGGPDEAPLVTDGPFIEGKESVGGFVSVEVADRAAAVALASTWPGLGVVEVRPAIERRPMR